VHAFESLLLLLLAAVVLAAAARRVGAPYPAFLALGGAALAFVPGAPMLVLEPDLALALFVAPVLLDSAFDSSPRDLKDNWAPLVGLVVVAVGLTTIAVASVTRALVPAMPWAAAITLGAVVAPPDAAAATAVLRQVTPPHRIMTILEGESLLNEATALLIYRLAVGATLAASFSIADVAPTFLIGVIGSIIIGPALAWGFVRLMERVQDVPSATILQFIGTFGVWILAESIGLSGVLTVVCFAITAARRAPEVTPARIRVPSYAVWDTTIFLLNVMAFVLIGLQIRPILDSLEPSVRTRYGLVALAVLFTVIAIRIVWVMSYNFVARWRVRQVGFHPPRPMLPPTVRGGLIVAWSGMRGVVSLAAALALPAAFPYRDLIVLTAFSIVLGTLVVQGLTLRPLLQWLDLRDDDPVGREVDLARERAAEAAVRALDGEPSQTAELLRRKYAALRRRSGHQAHTRTRTAEDEALHQRALAAARAALSELRATDEVGDAAFHRLEEELDWMELSSAAR